MASRAINIGMSIVFTAQSLAGGVINRTSDQMYRFGEVSKHSFEIARDSMRSTIAAAGLLAGALAGLKGMFNLAMAAGVIEQEFAAMRNIMSATEAEMKVLEKTSIDAALRTQFTSLQTTQALRTLGQAGATAAEAIGILNPALDLATASMGKLSPEMAAKTVNAALKAFGLRAEQSRYAVNALVNATNRFNISIPELAAGIGRLARGSVPLNQSLIESVTALGLVKNVMPSVTRASTLLSSAMLRLSDPKIKKKLDKYGVSIADAHGNFIPFLDMMWKLHGAMGQFNSQQKRAGVLVDLLGKQGMLPYSIIIKQLTAGIRGMDGVTRKGADAIKFMRLQAIAAQGDVTTLINAMAPKVLIDFATKVRLYGGVAGKQAHDMISTFKGQVDLLTGAIKTLGERIGAPIAAAFKPLVTFVFKIVALVIDIIDAIPMPVKTFIAQIGAVILGLMALEGVVILIISAIKIAMPFIIAFGAAFIEVILIVGAIILTIKLLKAMWDSNFGGMRDAIMGVIEPLQLFIGALKYLFTGKGNVKVLEQIEKASPFLDKMAGGIHALWVKLTLFATGFKDAFARYDILFTIGKAFQDIGVAIGSLIQSIGNLLQPLLSLLGITVTTGETWKDAGAFLGWFLGGIIKIIVVIIQGLTWIIRKVTQFIEILTSAFSFLFSGSTKVMGAVGRFFGWSSPPGTQPTVTPITPAALPGVLPVSGVGTAAAAGAGERKIEVTAKVAPIQIESKLEVDGKVLATSVKEIGSAESALGGVRSIGMDT